MALTHTKLSWVGNGATIIVDGAEPIVVQGTSHTLLLTMGTHTVNVTLANGDNTTLTLTVPKATADKVLERVAAEILNQGLKTPEQVAADVTAGIETALETAQGYFNLVKVNDVSIYNTGQNNDDTWTKFDLILKVDTTLTPTPVKIRYVYSDNTTQVVDVVDNQEYTATIFDNPPAGGLPTKTTVRLEILAGNNKVIDKLDTTLVVAETAPPPVCPSTFTRNFMLSHEGAVTNCTEIQKHCDDGTPAYVLGVASGAMGNIMSIKPLGVHITVTDECRGDLVGYLVDLGSTMHLKKDVDYFFTGKHIKNEDDHPFNASNSEDFRLFKIVGILADNTEVELLSRQYSTFDIYDSSNNGEFIQPPKTSFVKLDAIANDLDIVKIKILCAESRMGNSWSLRLANPGFISYNH